MSIDDKENLIYNRATRLNASTLGVLVGLAAVEHGYFEILQGNLAPGGLIIDAIGPAQELWAGASEPALTIIPNFIITGSLAMIIGLIYTIWAAVFIDRKYGAWIMLLLSIILFLVGGGFGPLSIGIFISILATRINKPLTWWRGHLSSAARDFLALCWPWSLIVYVLVYIVSVEVAIIGWPLVRFIGEDTTFVFLYAIGPIMLVLMLLMILSGFAYDIENLND